MGAARIYSTAVVMAAIFAGCSASPTPSPSTPPAAPLSCQDSRGPVLPGGGRTFGPVLLQGLDDRVDVPTAADAKVVLPHDGWYIRKLPLAIEPGSGTVTISTSDDAASTAWTTGAAWTSGVSPVNLRSAARSLTIERCPDVGNYLYGGLAAADPAACFTLTVEWQEGSARRTSTHRLDLAGTACS
jgi:hypothetical protein